MSLARRSDEDWIFRGSVKQILKQMVMIVVQMMIADLSAEAVLQCRRGATTGLTKIIRSLDHSIGDWRSAAGCGRQRVPVKRAGSVERILHQSTAKQNSEQRGAGKKM